MKRSISVLLVILMLVSIVPVTHAANRLSIDPTWTILVSESATASESSAARQLSDCLGEIFGTSLCYPASCMGAHVSACRRTAYRTKGDVALWGTFGYELDPNKLTTEDREIVKEQIAEYHKTYDLIRSGNLYRLICPWDNAFVCAWAFVSEDKREALVTIVRMRRQDDTLLHLKLQGLATDVIYTVEETGERFSGALLMFAGLEMTDAAWDDGESCKLHLIAN